MNEKERYIKTFTDINLNITVVEIKKDEIYKDYFLLPELYLINNELINSQIYIPQYPLSQKLKYSRGIIKDIDKYELIHLANIEEGSSGNPVFLKDNINIIY